MRGVLWYQGESNRTRPAEYEVLFPAMIETWRKQWGIGEFPFYYVQIAPKEWEHGNSAFLREAQLHSMEALPNMGMAVTLDIGECNQIHPADKTQRGRSPRLLGIGQGLWLRCHRLQRPGIP